MAMVLVVAYMVFLLIRPQDWVPGMIGLPTATLILPLALLVGAMGAASQPGKFRVPQSRLLLAYLVVTFVSTTMATGFGMGFGFTVDFAKRISVFFMMIWVLTSPGRIGVAVGTLLVLGLFLSYQALLQAQTGQGWGGVVPDARYEELRVRWHGDWDGPNVFGLLFVVVTGFALELVFGPHRLWTRLVGVGLSSAYVSAIFFTNSRGAILGLAAMLAFYFKDRFNKYLAIVLGPPVIAGLLMLGPSRMSQVSSGEQSARERTWLWEQGLRFLRENPVFGIGRGEFVRRVDLHLVSHNNYVQNFAELGLTGYFLFLAILWFCYKGALLVAQGGKTANPLLASYARMTSTALVGFGATTFFVLMELDLLHFLLGMCAAVYLVGRRDLEGLPELKLDRRELVLIGTGMVGIVAAIYVIAVFHIL